MSKVYLYAFLKCMQHLLEKEVAELLNKSDFVVFWDSWFWKFEVKYFDKFVPSEMECFIYSQPKNIANKLEAIIQERKQKNLNTNWVKHLWEIYENRYINS
jgi:hypothetical protein